MTLIGLLSDVHAAPEPVAEALSIFDRENVDLVLCAGDVAGYRDQLKPTVKLLLTASCQTVMGNHDQLYLDAHKAEQEKQTDNSTISFLRQLPAFYESVIDKKKLYMVHAEPPVDCHGGIKLLDKTGKVQSDMVDSWAKKLQDFNYDVLIVGHTHQVFVEKIASTLVINPGSTVFNNCCAILRLPDMTVNLYALSGRKIEKKWNWGDVIYGR